MDNNTSYIQKTSGLKAKDYIGYAFGDTACCLVFGLVTSLLQKFYTDVFLLNPLWIMIMMIIARIWDAVNDPIMGTICDTIKPHKSGRYKIWFLYAAIPLMVTAVLMFTKWPGLGNTPDHVGTFIYASITYILFGMAYTMLQIPYGSLANVVTTDEKERSKLSTYRAIGAGLGSLPVIIIASFCYKTRLDSNGNPILGENGLKLQDMQATPVLIGAIVLSLVAGIMLLCAYKMNKERVQIVVSSEKKDKTKTIKTIKTLFKNRSFISISCVSMLVLASQTFTQSYYLYLFNDFFSKNWMNMVATMCTYAPMAIFILFIPKMIRKFGKKEICAVGTAVSAIANIALALAKPLMPECWWLFLILCFVSGSGQVFIVLQLWSMATDAIDEIEIKTGLREDGTAYAFFTFFRKIGLIIAAVAVNGALLAMNYITEKGACQTTDTLNKMYYMATIIPGVMFAIMSLILFFAYPLNKKKLQGLQVEKEEKLKEDYQNNKIKIDN